MNDQIEIFEVGFSKTIIDAKIKDNKELKNTDNEAVFKSLQGDIKKLSSSINNIPKGKKNHSFFIMKEAFLPNAL